MSFYNMFNGFNISTISECYFGSTPATAIYYGSTEVWSAVPDYSKEYLTFESLEAGNVFKFYSTDETVSAKTIQYSTNKLDWTNVTASDAGTTIITLNAGQKVYLRGDNPHGMNYWKSGIGHKPCYFGASKKFNISGCIMSLSFMDNTSSYNSVGDGGAMNMLFHDSPVVDASNLILNQVYATSNACTNMFLNCTQLTGAPALPATTLSNYCYQSMFQNCTSLTTAPELPATTLANYCYNSMFQNCTSLTTAPELPATTLATSCYRGMFQNCPSLTTAPTLSATTLAEYCYRSMFYQCSGLTSVQASLPATTLANNCYQYMFDYCRSLSTAPELPATTLANNCYEYMFANTAITTVPALPAQILMPSCYKRMFEGCTSLTSFIRVTGETADRLVATTLATSCCESMFEGCTSLVKPFVLNRYATDLVASCYKRMFYGCSSLNNITCLALNGINTNNSTTDWLYGVAADGGFNQRKGASWGSRSTSTIPSGWRVNALNV